MDLNLSVDNGKFVCRVAGIIIHNNKVLFETRDDSEFWAPPGGTVAFGESSIDAIKRELKEELGVEVNIERLLWTTEGFFVQKGKPIHSFMFYYLGTIENDKGIYGAEDPFLRRDQGDRGNLMTFQWHDLNKLNELKVFPEFLKIGLLKLPTSTEHIIHD